MNTKPPLHYYFVTLKKSELNTQYKMWLEAWGYRYLTENKDSIALYQVSENPPMNVTYV